MVDYELQPFNFTAEQFKSIFLQDQEHAFRNGETLSRHVDWLLETCEALRGHGLDERQISAELGWLSNREKISECLSGEDGYRLMERDREKMSEYLRRKYSP